MSRKIKFDHYIPYILRNKHIKRVRGVGGRTIRFTIEEGEINNKEVAINSYELWVSESEHLANECELLVNKGKRRKRSSKRWRDLAKYFPRV